MNRCKLTTVGSRILVTLLALVSLVLVYLVATGRNLGISFLSTDQAVLVAIYLLGIAMCAVGGVGRVLAEHGWTSAFSVIGCLLGAFTAVSVIAVLLGDPLPVIPNERAAFGLVASIIAVKLAFDLMSWLATAAHKLAHRSTLNALRRR